MKVHIYPNAEEMGLAAAQKAADILNDAISHKGFARLILSTGQSQFEILEALIKHPVDWTLVEMFHLDEYIGLSETHPASFRKYLQERFVSKVSLKKVHFINGEGDVAVIIQELNEAVRQASIDLGLIGIGENAHIAFNDPPADFEIQDPYIIVNLNDDCKQQQVREGWFSSINDVPAQAISMSVRRILLCQNIISCVPHAVKARAVRMTLESNINPLIPASILKTHPAWDIFLDVDSASELND